MSNYSNISNLDLSKAEGNIFLNSVDLDNILLQPNSLAVLPLKDKYTKLVQSIAQYYGTTSHNVVLGNGSDELIDHIAFARRGGISLTLAPTFERLYEVNIKYDYDVHIYDLPKNNDYKYSSKFHEDFLKKIKLLQPDIIWLCSPGNPTGTIIAPNYLHEIASKFKSSWVVLDIAFIDITDINLALNYVKIAHEYDNVLVLNSFSKSWGIAALRIGCLFTNSKIAKVIAHQNVMFNINSIALEIAQNCIDNDGYRKSEFTLIHNHLDIIRKAIVDMPNFELIANSNINLFCLKHHNIPELYKKLLDLGLKTKSLDRMPGMIDSGYCRILIPRDIKDVELLLKILSSIA